MIAAVSNNPNQKYMEPMLFPWCPRQRFGVLTNAQEARAMPEVVAIPSNYDWKRDNAENCWHRMKYNDQVPIMMRPLWGTHSFLLPPPVALAGYYEAELYYDYRCTDDRWLLPPGINAIYDDDTTFTTAEKLRYLIAKK